MEKACNILFSPTGGTRKAAECIADGLGLPCEEVDLSKADFAGCTVEPGSFAVIAAPSYGGRAPKTAIERLKMVQGNGAKAIVVAVFGNRAQEDTLIELADVAKECGFEVVAGIEAVAEHSIAHQYATGRPDAADAEQLAGFARQILDKIKETAGAAPAIPGNCPYKKAGPGLVPKATSACGGCGLCARMCPVGAIDKTNPRLTDKAKCINCMRCVSICPRKARKANSLMVKLVGLALKKPCGTPKENKLYL